MFSIPSKNKHHSWKSAIILKYGLRETLDIDTMDSDKRDFEYWTSQYLNPSDQLYKF